MPKSFKEQSQLTVRDVFGMRATNGDLGVELELEGTGPLGQPVRGWDVHEEGSLRAPGGQGRGGAEYVTHGAMALGAIRPLVQRLNEAFEGWGVVVNLGSHRTSTHVHINVQNLTMIDVLGMIVVFTAIEPMLMALCGNRRDGNSFCASSYDTGDLPEYLHHFCKQLEKFRGRDYGLEMWQRGKYASLSTFRLFDLGTLEARCFPTSVNPDEIEKWCSWMLKIRDTAVNNQDKSFRNLVKEGIHNPVSLAREIFGETHLPYNKVVDLVNFGSQQAYELTRILKRFLKKEAPEEKAPAKKGKKSLFGAGVAQVGLENLQALDAAARANWREIPQPQAGWGDVAPDDEVQL